MSQKTYSVALSRETHDLIARHLLRSDGQEDLCFALWNPSQGRSRISALISQLILPKDGERQVHGNASFLPVYFERAVTEAARAKAGLAFLHSHCGPGWQDMSSDDIKAELKHAAAVKGATGFPLVGMTLGTDGAWSARFWEKTAPRSYQRHWCSQVRVVGDRLAVTFTDALLPKPRQKNEQLRTVSAWGEDIQADLTRLRIGIVGAGSVGSIIAEALARIGIRPLKLIDFDLVEKHNLDRLLHAITRDAKLHRSKVSVLARALRNSATADNFLVEEIERSICEEEGFREALDCDILFSCVDRPWPRSVLNFIAYAHLIPVVDGGVQVGVTKQRKLRYADWRAHVAMPGRRCLACIGQYDAGLVQTEREGRLDDPEYINGLPHDHQIRRNENVFAFSLGAASLQVLQMLMMVIAPLGIASPGEQKYHFVPGLLDKPSFDPCDDSCPYPRLISQGDLTNLVVTGPHKRAEETRRLKDTTFKSKGWRLRLSEVLYRLADRLAGA